MSGGNITYAEHFSAIIDVDQYQPRDASVAMARGSPRSGDQDGTTARYPIESVAKASRVLDMLSTMSQLKLSDVAEQLAVSVSTAHRLLTTLEDEQLLKQNATSRLYEPGPRLLAIAHAVTPQRSRWDFARPFLAELSERLGETVNLHTLQGTDVAFVESVEAPTPLRVGSRLGAVMPAHCTSGGKLLLAQLTEHEIKDRYPRVVLTQMTDKSIATRDDLFAELRRVSRRGYATNFGESEPGISGVAVLVADSAGPPKCALAVSAPSSRLSQARVKEFVEDMRKTAALLADADSATI
jgi:DNA-binding IclR family transcriptional regulator